jgi:hypothetical protein
MRSYPRLLAAAVLWVAVASTPCHQLRQLSFAPVSSAAAAPRTAGLRACGARIRMKAPSGGLIRVVGAVVIRDGLVFMAQRPLDKVP